MPRKKDKSEAPKQPNGPVAVKLDRKVYDYIAVNAQPFEQPSEVLARLLGIGAKK